MVAAHYWNGGDATAVEVKDVSETGAYLVTTERWYLGTILTITLNFRSGPDAVEPPDCITLPCKVVRHGRTVWE
jgi:hypothetical protein